MWSIKKIKDFGEIYTGKTPSTSDESNFGADYMFVTPGDLLDFKYILKTERYISEKGIKYTTKIPPNSICVACIGYIGKIGITTKECCTNQQINSLVVNKDYDIHYVYYVLLYYSQYFKELAGTNVVPQLNKSEFSKIKIQVTNNLQEQKTIAAILSKVDEAIAAVEESIKSAEKVKKALMQNLLTGKLKPDGTWRSEDEFYTDEKFGKIPKGWEINRLKQMTILCQYGLNICAVDDGKIPMFRMNNIIEGKMVSNPMVYVNLSDNEFQKYKLEKGDILFNRTNSMDLVGKVGIFELEGEFVFASYLIRIRANTDNIPEYINYYLNSYQGQKNLRSKATPAVSQANINAKSLINSYLPKPPIKEQEKIVKIIQANDAIRKSKHAKIETLKKLKKSLMQNLLTGKIRVNPSQFQHEISSSN